MRSSTHSALGEAQSSVLEVLGEGVVTEGCCRPGSSPRKCELDLEEREGQ